MLAWAVALAVVVTLIWDAAQAGWRLAIRLGLMNWHIGLTLGG
jgi:hypothetical protein